MPRLTQAVFVESRRRQRTIRRRQLMTSQCHRTGSPCKCTISPECGASYLHSKHPHSFYTHPQTPNALQPHSPIAMPLNTKPKGHRSNFFPLNPDPNPKMIYSDHRELISAHFMTPRPKSHSSYPRQRQEAKAVKSPTPRPKALKP